MNTKIKLSSPFNYKAGRMVVIIKKNAVYEAFSPFNIGLFKKYIYSEYNNEPISVVLWNPELHMEVTYDLSEFQVTSVQGFITLLRGYTSKYFKIKKVFEEINQ